MEQQAEINVMQLVNAIDKLQKENEEIRKVLQAQHSTQPQLPTTPKEAIPEPKVALPKKFDGSRHLFRGFINQVRLVIQLQPRRYATDAARVGLIGTLLEGPALAWFAPLLESSSPRLNDFKTFLEDFEATFGDTEKARTAATKIRKLRQGTRPAATYASEFRLLACDVPWGEAALIDQFRHGLQDAVKDLLLMMKEPEDLNEAITQAVKCDNRLYERQQERRLTSRSHTFASTHFTKPAQTHHTLAPSAPSSSAEPMQLDGIRTKTLSHEERQRRMKENLCLFCGQPGHIARKCPKRTSHRISQVNSRPKKDKQEHNPENHPEIVGGLRTNSKKQLVTIPDSSDNNNFTTPVTLQLDQPVSTKALIDSGASACFVDSDFAKAHTIPLVTKREPLELEVIDGREIACGMVKEETVPIELRIGDQKEKLVFNVIPSPHHPIILGLPWLKYHNPDVDWRTGKISFQRNGDDRSHPGTIPTTVPAPIDSPKVKTTTEPRPNPIAKISFISAKPFLDEAKENQAYIAFASPGQKDETIPSKLPEKYADYADVFDERNASLLPEHRPYDCAIELEPGTQPPFGPIYGLTETELHALKEYVDEHLAKGFIRHSQSPAGAPILFVKKKDGSLRMCVDYRGLNKITVKNRYPLPLISNLLDQLASARIYSKIDLRGAYNLVRIKPGDEWKTAFRTRYGHFEYTVMPFGLTNAPAIFQHLMNDVFREYLDVFVVIYLDDILVFSGTQEDHDRHVKLVLEKLRSSGLYAKLEKCEFDRKQVEFLGYIVSTDGLKMDPRKVSTVLTWARPTSPKDIQCFLGFANFYRHFIKDFSRLAAPLQKLTHKNNRFEWSESTEKAFTSLKQAFTSAPILTYADPARPYIMETDASDYALGAVLSQTADDGLLHPVAFYSRKFTPSEINYDVHDKELLAIVTAFKEWRRYLEGARHKVTVLCDHKNLQYFTTSRTLNRRQARWSLLLADFDFEITFRPGRLQGKPDALSRRPEYQPKRGDGTEDQRKIPLLKTTQLRLQALIATPKTTLSDQIRQHLKNDPTAEEIRQQLRDNDSPFEEKEGLILRKQKIYLPSTPLRLKVLTERHDSPAAGHFGIHKTLELVSRDFWWPGWRKFVKDYVKSCDACARAKTSRHQPHGLLQPLPVPEGPWNSISMDFISDLPVSKGHDTILVVVDRFTKMAHFIACNKNISAEETAELVLRHVVRLHGLPNDIVTDRGTQFTSKFWSRLFELFGTQIKLSTAFHPQSDGQTERVNQILEQYLRCYINYQQDNWTSCLPMAEFAYNNAEHTSTKQTPFHANYGYHPRLSVNSPRKPVNPAAENYIETLQQNRRTLKEELKRAQDSYKKFADNKRQKPPTIRPGDLVWLLRRNIRTQRPSDKLDYKRIGPFKVIRQVSPVAYQLQLPHTFRIHDVFHVSLLEPRTHDTIANRIVSPAPPVVVQGTTEYEVARVLDSRLIRRKVHYLIEWKNYSKSEATWEPYSLCKAAERILRTISR